MTKPLNLQFHSLIILCICLACSTKVAHTYEEGLRKCAELRDSTLINHPNIIMVTSRNCIVGSSIPEIKAQTLSGNKIDASYFSGRAGIINFWFESCPPCVAEIPYLNKMVESYGREKFFYLAIGRDSKEDIISFLDEHPWSFDQIENGKVLTDSTFRLTWGYPTSFIINKDGIITHSFGGLNEKNEKEIFDIFKTLAN